MSVNINVWVNVSRYLCTVSQPWLIISVRLSVEYDGTFMLDHINRWEAKESTCCTLLCLSAIHMYVVTNFKRICISTHYNIILLGSNFVSNHFKFVKLWILSIRFSFQLHTYFDDVIRSYTIMTLLVLRLLLSALGHWFNQMVLWCILFAFTLEIAKVIIWSGQCK